MVRSHIDLAEPPQDHMRASLVEIRLGRKTTVHVTFSPCIASVLHGHGINFPTRPFDMRVGRRFLRDSRPEGRQSTDLGRGTS